MQARCERWEPGGTPGPRPQIAAADPPALLQAGASQTHALAALRMPWSPDCGLRQPVECACSAHDPALRMQAVHAPRGEGGVHRLHPGPFIHCCCCHRTCRPGQLATLPYPAQVGKVVRLIQVVALTLNKHYPARLHRLFLVETPRVVHWPVQARTPPAPARQSQSLYLLGGLTRRAALRAARPGFRPARARPEQS